MSTNSQADQLELPLRWYILLFGKHLSKGRTSKHTVGRQDHTMKIKKRTKNLTPLTSSVVSYSRVQQKFATSHTNISVRSCKTNPLIWEATCFLPWFWKKHPHTYPTDHWVFHVHTTEDSCESHEIARTIPMVGTCNDTWIVYMNQDLFRRTYLPKTQNSGAYC